MSKKTMEDLIGRTLTDSAFRDRLLADPEKTLADEGYEVDPKVVEGIKNANPDDIRAMTAGVEAQLAQRKAAS